MAKSDGANAPTGQERSLFLLLREAGDALEAASPPFDAAAAATRLRRAAQAHGFLRPDDDMPEKDLAVRGASLEEEAPPFDVEAGAARLGQAARARGLLSDSAIHATGDVEGIDLSTVLERDGPLLVTDAAWIIAELASVLGGVHAAGLIHHDVKPSNVLIAGDIENRPSIHLIDFGVARSTSGHALPPASTVVYMAPERISGSPADQRADVYSLACVLYQLLTGRPPFSREMVPVMWEHLNAVPPAPSTLRPGLPTAVDEVVARGLAKDPAHRYGTVDELAEAILAATGTVSIPVAGADQARDPRHPPTVKDSVLPDDSSPIRSGSDVPLWDSDPHGRARAVLRAIVSDPDRGVAALSSAQAMSTALKDLLPGMPRETKVLLAAAEQGVAEALRYHVARGMDPATVQDKVARSFARHTGFRSTACQWAVDELAAVLGLGSASTEQASIERAR